MEKDQFLKQFVEIEEKVSRLIESVKTQEAANEELKNRIAGLEQELQEKIEEEKQYQDERSLIRSKIDSLLSRLEEIPEGD